MEVKMNKEIRNYQESMFMGLNLRQRAKKKRMKQKKKTGRSGAFD